MKKTEQLEEAVDVVRFVMHRWQKLTAKMDAARSLRGDFAEAAAMLESLDKEREAEWQKIRPALRKLQGE